MASHKQTDVEVINIQIEGKGQRNKPEGAWSLLFNALPVGEVPIPLA